MKSLMNVEKAIVRVTYPTDPSMIKGREFCSSLYVAEDVKVGDGVTGKSVRSLGLVHGAQLNYMLLILGKKVVKDIVKGQRSTIE